VTRTRSRVRPSIRMARVAGTLALTVIDTMTGVSGTQGGIAVHPAVASRFVLAAPSAVPALTPLRMTVTALDAYGNRAVGYTGKVHFTSSDSLAWLPADYAFSASDAGQHAFTRGLVLWQAGTQTVKSTDVETAITGLAAVQVEKWGSEDGTNGMFGF